MIIEANLWVELTPNIIDLGVDAVFLFMFWFLPGIDMTVKLITWAMLWILG